MKSPVVLDTNVASFVFGKKPEAALYRDDLADRRIVLSFMTMAEMLFGADNANWSKKKRADLQAFFDKYGVLYADKDIVVTWAKMQKDLRTVGKTLDDPDSWIAATALATDLPLVAHDAAFRFVPGLELICRAPGAMG